MDEAACLIGAATPKFAQMVSRKLVELPAAEVMRDLHENHARQITVDFVQTLERPCRDPGRSDAPGSSNRGSGPAGAQRH